MESPRPRNKGVYILPNLFTTASLFAGFWGAILATQGNFEACALAILFSALMDGLDGKVARLTNTASEFGVQYDSLADLVAFGFTPAFMVYQYALSTFDKVGMAVAFLFTVCAALRLARFNISTAVTNKKFFIGLATPAAGCTLALLILFIPFLPEFMMGGLPVITLILTATLAFLMVSSIRYASFKEASMFKAYPFRTMVSIAVLFSLILTNPKFYGFLIMVCYLASGIIYSYILLPRRNKILQKHGPAKPAEPATTEQSAAE